ncbi:MAG TPA: hypothetical protein PLO23_06365, partial [Alphaproteobacteria bacterium]|nr:hypothetical protein [Alphaproteobacteria bacterium]
RQAVRAVNSLSKTFQASKPQNDGIFGPLAKISYNVTKHLFWRRRDVTQEDNLSTLMSNEMIGNALQLVGSLTHNFAAQDILIPNDRWDKHLQEAGFFGRKLSESPIGIIYGAHNKAKAQPFYLGYIPPHLLSAEFKDGLLLGGHDLSHGEAVKAVTTIPFIFKPHRLADDIILEDMILADGPHNLVSWLAMRCPISPKFGGIKVIYIGSGDRHDEVNAEAGTETAGFERILEFKKGAKNGSRRAAFATIRRTLANHNGHSGAEQDLYVIDTSDRADRDFTNLSKENIERIMVEDGAESWRQNTATFEAIASMLAHNYIVECNFNKAMRLARERILNNWQSACAWNDMIEQSHKPLPGESYDINDEMGPDPIRILALEDPTPPEPSNP